MAAAYPRCVAGDERRNNDGIRAADCLAQPHRRVRGHGPGCPRRSGRGCRPARGGCSGTGRHARGGGLPVCLPGKPRDDERNDEGVFRHLLLSAAGPYRGPGLCNGRRCRIRRDRGHRADRAHRHGVAAETRDRSPHREYLCADARRNPCRQERPSRRSRNLPGIGGSDGRRASRRDLLTTTVPRNAPRCRSMPR